MVGGPQWLKCTRYSSAIERDGKHGRSIQEVSRVHVEVGSSHWKLLETTSTHCLAAADKFGYTLSLSSSRVRCLGLRTLEEVVRPLLHRIGRKTEE
jgi:predicted urease superfamily metal-dependent hydrolase